ncbi:CHAT domain-containing tetratricopeptide repeat protein [Microcoleus sp. FACHB-68]|uniref:CHAT domain-containing protein n=1 Tax=Microcoleus sp. FACHB-68 TaxID=2692826 RepID=UPI001682148E|nr:CHAT domain-containing tetratricopeptide repeat protein [Microcoleus sp. FACHB-68]MBD1938754.1 CHAT domain-containing protein [Microcoleus sp. FACHB-68]
MRLKKFLLSASTTVFLLASQTLRLGFPERFATSPVVAQTSEARKAQADNLLDQGGEQLNASEFEAALQSWQQALSIYRGIKNRQGEAAALVNLGLGYLKLRDNAKAIEYLQQSLTIVRAIRDRQTEAWALNILGFAYNNLGDYPKAIEYLQQSLIIARAIPDRNREVGPLGNLGIAYNNLGDYPKAIEYYQQSLTIARAIRDRQTEGKALNMLGVAYDSLGDYAQAIKHYQQSLTIARAIGDRETEGAVLGNLGLVYNNLGDYTRAIEYYQQLLVIANEIRDSQSQGAALGNLGIAYEFLGDYAKAIEYYQQSLAIVRVIDDRRIEGHALNNLGIAYFKQGNVAAAEQTLIAAMNVKESQRSRDLDDRNKVSFFETQRNTYLWLQKVLISQTKTDKALEISERGRARAFVELLTKRLSPQPDTPTIIKPPSLDHLKKNAQQQNTTLVEYSIFNFTDEEKSELYIWVISPNGKVTFRQLDLKSLEATGGSTQLQKLVAQTLESLGVGEDRNGIFEVTVANPTADPQRQIKSLKELHQLLIQPIADVLPTEPNSHVIFIPHQELFRVPFPALMDSEGKYLVEKHTILTAPSIQMLELTHQQRQNVSRSGQGALVVGNPSPMPAGFSPLFGAEKEAKQVAQLLNTQPLIGSGATEPAVLQQLSNARIIHLATHGIFNEQQPLEGAIALAAAGNNSQNNGLLTAEEIFNLDRRLNAELLVLSACNTGRGKITGDGVIGLSRSFITAGIPSVIVSLWAVPDAPTAELMTEFYTNLYQKKLDKAQALRQAMLKMMEKHRNNPRAWAAFTLIGEAE